MVMCEGGGKRGREKGRGREDEGLKNGEQRVERKRKREEEKRRRRKRRRRREREKKDDAAKEDERGPKRGSMEVV